MTISYSSEVPNGSSFGCFWKILWKWRGSVYKLVWRELLAYLSLYYTINLVYRYALNDDQKRIFEKVRQYFGAQTESIPMSFVLGFYVSLVVKRWWEQYRLLPWPDTLALFISAAIPGNQEIGRLMRRNIMRYMVLSYVITLQRISLRVKRRFPGWQHLVDAGLMLESERKIFEIMDAKSPMSKYWMPLVWATNIINRARKDGLITSDQIVQTLLIELSDIRRRLGGLIGYDTVCVPLVYTQVVTLVLYTYFVAALMGRQMVPLLNEANGKFEDPDLYFPLFTALQFCFYVGWLKVAEVLINPFGEDDDDIELNWLIDRHIKAAYMIVDEMHEEHPELLKDQYWEEVVPKDLPYTVASEHYRRHEPKGSAEHYKVKEADAVYANIMPGKRQHDDVYADYESVDTPVPDRRSRNWFRNKLNAMGSVRSSSTAYSSSFNRNRHNSVYSSPEAGLPITNPVLHHKMSLYDKFVGRKSGRNRQLLKQNSKSNLNGQVGQPPRNRPRIPTPDVTKESDRNESRLSHMNPFSGIQSIASGVALTAQQLATNPSIYPSSTNNVPVVGTLLLSRIEEADSLNNTLQSGHPSTTSLARSVLPMKVNMGSKSSLRSLMIPVSTIANDMRTSTTNSFVVLPANSHSNSSNHHELIPVSITTLTLTNTSSSATGATITELPLDQPDGFGDWKKPASRTSSVMTSPDSDHHSYQHQKLDRQQSAASTSSKPADSLSVISSKTMDSGSPGSTLTKRAAKNSEVYV